MFIDGSYPLGAAEVSVRQPPGEVLMPAADRSVLRDGLYAGLIGYAVIAVFFALLNLAAGRPVLHTAALLGSAMFFGLEDPAALEITPDAVFAFNMVHMLVMVGTGVVTSWLVEESERHPVFQWAALFALLFVAFHLFAAVSLFATPLLGGDAWLPIAVASVLAAAAMAWFLLRSHPLLRRELREIQMGEVPPEVL